MTDVTTPAGKYPPRDLREPGIPYRLEVFWRKNGGLLRSGKFWRLVPRVVAARYKRREQEPLTDYDFAFVATHHKSMTTYFHAVLRALSVALDLPFEAVNSQLPRSSSKLFLSMQGKQDWSELGNYKGVHVIRDPRDMIVSGYHYHKWTHEPWVHRLDDNGESYQQKLNRLDKRSGLFLEIQHFIYFYRETLESWDVADPNMLEVSYESLMAEDREERYEAIFEHLGLQGSDLDLSVDLMRLFEAGSRGGKLKGSEHSHLRSGKSNQWQSELGLEHIELINAELGGVLRKFGYT